MRLSLPSALALAALAAPAFAAPASVSVAVAPKLQHRFDTDYGVREAQMLTADLKAAVERSLQASSAYDGARIELTITDAKPSRPTFKQLGDQPSLSMQSFGLGGASIEGRIVTADGASQPVSYRWYETDIRQAPYHWVWTDAELSFDRFAHRLARGEELAER